MKPTYFIAGTDTDAGKTCIAAGLLHKANGQGLRSLALKPLAAGCHVTADGLRNQDALTLQATASVSLAYEQVNPVAFEPPIAPHIAAAAAGKNITADRLAALCRGALMTPHDFALIEGAGGWRVPLNHRETLASLPRLLNLPVILVVGMKLGCLNHALLSAEAIVRDGLVLAGWVANHVDPDMSCLDENLATLHQLLAAPCLGEVPFLADPVPKQVAACLDLSPLLSVLDAV